MIAYSGSLWFGDQYKKTRREVHGKSLQLSGKRPGKSGPGPGDHDSGAYADQKMHCEGIKIPRYLKIFGRIPPKDIIK
jgi:hypothetical protein